MECSAVMEELAFVFFCRSWPPRVRLVLLHVREIRDPCVTTAGASGVLPLCFYLYSFRAHREV